MISAPVIIPTQAARTLELSEPEATDGVIVDQADRLHEGVAHRRTDEPKTAPLEVSAEPPRYLGLGRDLTHALPACNLRRALDERPAVGVQAAPFGGHLQDSPRVRDCRLDLQSVADDSRVGQQPGDRLVAESGDYGGVEAGERALVSLAFVEDRGPRQARLGPFEHEHLEQMAIVVRGRPPLFVVIREVQRVARRHPAAAGQIRHRGRACGCAVSDRRRGAGYPMRRASRAQNGARNMPAPTASTKHATTPAGS